MWETQFEESMLELPNGVVIRCPTQEAFEDAGKILEEHGIVFGIGSSVADHPEFWNTYEDDTCLYSRPGRALLYGPTRSTEETSYCGYTKCTFYGCASEPDFSQATEVEISLLLGGD